MKKLVIVGMSLVAIVAAAATNDTATAQKAKRPKLNRAKVAENFNRRTGGWISFPGAKQGKIVFVNAQAKAPEEWLQEVAAFHSSALKVDIDVARGAFSFPETKVEGNATLFIIDDARMPTIKR